MEIRELRKQKKLTQKQASEMTGIPLRTYKLYETDLTKEGSLKYNYILHELEKYGFIDESHGILSINEIAENCKPIFEEYKMYFCILFGSYAKGDETETSDVDLLVDGPISGIRFYGMVEKLRNALRKNVDVLNIQQLLGNEELLRCILKEGVRIYVQR